MILGRSALAFILCRARPGVAKRLWRNEALSHWSITHRAAHAGEGFAEAQVVGGVRFGRFAFGPIPIAAVLEIDDENGMIVHDGSARLHAQVVYATELRFFENLRAHDGGADGHNHPAVEGFHARSEEAKIDSGSASDDAAVEHGMV